MAFSALTLWEFQTGGNNANGGGFYDADPGTSVDLALANTPVAFTDLIIDAVDNTKITSVLRPFVAADAGNILNVTGGVNFTVQRVQITAVDGSNIATCDKAVGTTGSIAGTGNMGGALAIPLDAFLELSIAGNTWYMKSGTYALTESLVPAIDGTAAAPIKFYGYKTTRGDNPSGLDRPLMTCGNYIIDATGGYYWLFKNLRIVGTGTTCLTLSQSGSAENVQAINYSVSANQNALALSGGVSASIFRCEASCTNGYGVLHGISSSVVSHSFIHGCSVGIYNNAFTPMSTCLNIIADCTTYGIYIRNTNIGDTIIGNTLYGAETPYGIGIYDANANEVSSILGNIIYGWATGISKAADNKLVPVEYNNIYNCTTPVTNVVEGATDIALDPEFVGVGNSGSNLCTNGADWTDATGSTPPTGWAVVTAGTFTITAGGQAGNYLKIEHNGVNDNPAISFQFSTTAGKWCRVVYYAQKGDATTLGFKVGATSGGSEIYGEKTHTDTDWNTPKVVEFFATGATSYITVIGNTTTSGQYVMLDTVSIYLQGNDFTPGTNMKLTIDWTKMGC